MASCAGWSGWSASARPASSTTAIRALRARASTTASGARCVIGLNGIVGFSRYPLQLISIVGIGLAGLAFLLGARVPGLEARRRGVPGRQSDDRDRRVFFSGIQLLSLGVIGEYIGRIYDESRSRPKYILESRYGWEDGAVSRVPALRQNALPPCASWPEGLGHALGERVRDTPKPLIEVAGEPFLMHQLRLLAAHGAARGRAVCRLSAASRSSAHRYRVRWVAIALQLRRTRARRHARARFAARCSLLGERFLVLYGDTYLRIDYARSPRPGAAAGFRR